MMPALVITGPVATSARSAPRRVPILLRLLADAVHEEDVVVDPQRHEEDEGEDREARIEARLVEHLREEHEDTPKIPKNDRITEPIRYSGATIARSSAISVSRITSSTSGTIEVEVALGAVAVVAHDRRHAADVALSAPDRAPASASRISSRAVERLVAVRVVGERDA